MCYSRAFITPQSQKVDDDLQVKFQRECTNFWCLIIFVLFWIYYIIILAYGIARGRKYLDVYIFIYLRVDYSMELIIMEIFVVKVVEVDTCIILE